MKKFSLLDLSPVPEGKFAADALSNTVNLARAAEAAGYHRFWLAEHHNMPGIASAATAVVIGHVAGATKTMRIGAGGIMLPNQAPLIVAEQFGTLATLYPDRIDLGLGRAPGTDMATARALRRHMAPEDSFPQDVQELIDYFGDTPDNAPGLRLQLAGTIWRLKRRFNNPLPQIRLDRVARHARPPSDLANEHLVAQRPFPDTFQNPMSITPSAPS